MGVIDCVAVGVGGVPVTVGEGVTVAIMTPAREIMGLIHNARSSSGEPYAEITRMNFTSCPASELRSRLAL